MASSSLAVAKEQFPIKAFWVGIGCKQGTPKRQIEQAIQAVFEEHSLHEDAIAGLATIDTKVNEAGLIEFCRDRNLPLLFFKAEVLRTVAVPNPSNATEAAVNTPSVAEAAAILASWWESEAKSMGYVQAIAETQRLGGIAPALLPTPSAPILHIPKLRYGLGESQVSVTIAVSRSL